MKYVAVCLLLTACGPDPALLTVANNHVNKATPYRKGGYDCRFYVRDKYYALKAQGVPESEMTVLYGITDTLEAHVVLRVGDRYLDNRYGDIGLRPRMRVVAELAPGWIDWNNVPMK